MTPLLLVFQREYRVRLRRPSFWVLTLLIPIVVAVLYALPVWAVRGTEQVQRILVVDQTGLFANGIRSTDKLHFQQMPSLEYAQRQQGKDDAILYIPLRQTSMPRDAYLLYRSAEPSPLVRSQVDAQLQRLLQDAVLEDVYDVSPTVFRSVESTHIALHVQDATEGRESFGAMKSRLSAVLSAVLLIALIVFGVQTMRAVQEERQNRTVELLSTSLPPTTLLLGKLLAIAAAAITQIVLWGLLCTLLVQGIQALNQPLFEQARAQEQLHSLSTKGAEATALYENPVQMVDETVRGLVAIRLPLVAMTVLGCFLLGYLLYGALIALVAARTESDADALQWVLLLLSPLACAVVLTPIVAGTPHGSLSVWLTLIPLTSPVAILQRLPFGLPWPQLAASILLMLIAAAFALWAAATTYKRHCLTH